MQGETYISVNLRDWLQRIEDKLDRSQTATIVNEGRITALETKVNAVPIVASAIGGTIGVIASLASAVFSAFNKG